MKNTFHFRSRRAAVPVKIVAIAAAAGLLITIVALTVRAGFKLNTEAKIRENLQAVWVIANNYFLQNSKDEVSLRDLAKYEEPSVKRLSNLKIISGEDYEKINGGTLRRTTTKLSIEYGKGGKDKTVTYDVNPPAKKK